MSLSFLILYILQFLIVLRALRIHSDLLVCPVLPESLPDDIEWFEILKGVRGIRNYQFTIRMNLLWNPYRSEKIVFSCIGDIQNSGTFPRGIYQVLNYHLRVTDWAGFFVLNIPGHAPSRLTVYPGDHRKGVEINLFHQSYSDHTAPVPVLRNQEEFDARPYHAGDDPRRIHWKMMARHEELFIREGSGVSRDKKSVLLLLDPGQIKTGYGFGKRKTFQKTDSMIRSFSAVLESLEDEGFSVWGVFPGTDRYTGLSSLSRRDRRFLLASIPPEPLKRVPEPAGRAFGSILLFTASSPDSVLLESIEKYFGTASKTMILSPDEPVENRRRGWSVGHS